MSTNSHTPNFGPIGKEVYERTYSRIKHDGSNEIWEETVLRVVTGNCDLVSDISPVSDDERHKLYNEILNFNLMPAGRHLWVSGVPDRQFLFNCHVAGWTQDYTDHVAFVMDELMKGGGIGANYSGDLLEKVLTVKLPKSLGFYCDKNHPDFEEIVAEAHVDTVFPLPTDFTKHVQKDKYIIKLADSRQGWVDGLRAIVNGQFADCDLMIDISNIRSYGKAIEGFGGTASGPLPLVLALGDIYKCLHYADGEIRTEVALNVDHIIAACVIAGNVRRSARMSIVHWNDPFINEFIKLKQHDGVHWSTNISVEVDKDFWRAVESGSLTAIQLLRDITEAMVLNGEPGIYNSSYGSEDENTILRATNPCGEIALEDWENCNLGHVNLAHCESQEQFIERAKLMTRFLMRATFGDITNPLQQNVVDDNRRIGVGVYGAQEWILNQFSIALSELERSPGTYQVTKALQECYYAVQAEALDYAFELDINIPIKLTTVAPTGTISQLSGHTSGIHPVYAKRYIRRVRYGKDDPAIQQAQQAQNVYSIEDDKNTANTTIVAFKCVDPILARVFDIELVESVDELSIREQLFVQQLFQQYWADNAVSYTCNIDPNINSEELYMALKEFGPYLKGTTVFPDSSRAQQPIERIYELESDDDIDMQIESDTTQDCVNGVCPVK